MTEKSWFKHTYSGHILKSIIRFRKTSVKPEKPSQTDVSIESKHGPEKFLSGSLEARNSSPQFIPDANLDEEKRLDEQLCLKSKEMTTHVMRSGSMECFRGSPCNFSDVESISFGYAKSFNSKECFRGSPCRFSDVESILFKDDKSKKKLNLYKLIKLQRQFLNSIRKRSPRHIIDKKPNREKRLDKKLYPKLKAETLVINEPLNLKQCPKDSSAGPFEVNSLSSWKVTYGNPDKEKSLGRKSSFEETLPKAMLSDSEQYPKQSSNGSPYVESTSSCHVTDRNADKQDQLHKKLFVIAEETVTATGLFDSKQYSNESPNSSFHVTPSSFQHMADKKPDKQKQLSRKLSMKYEETSVTTTSLDYKEISKDLSTDYFEVKSTSSQYVINKTTGKEKRPEEQASFKSKEMTRTAISLDSKQCSKNSSSVTIEIKLTSPKHVKDMDRDIDKQKRPYRRTSVKLEKKLSKTVVFDQEQYSKNSKSGSNVNEPTSSQHLTYNRTDKRKKPDRRISVKVEEKLSTTMLLDQEQYSKDSSSGSIATEFTSSQRVTDRGIDNQEQLGRKTSIKVEEASSKTMSFNQELYSKDSSNNSPDVILDLAHSIANRNKDKQKQLGRKTSILIEEKSSVTMSHNQEQNTKEFLKDSNEVEPGSSQHITDRHTDKQRKHGKKSSVITEETSTRNVSFASEKYSKKISNTSSHIEPTSSRHITDRNTDKKNRKSSKITGETSSTAISYEFEQCPTSESLNNSFEDESAQCLKYTDKNVEIEMGIGQESSFESKASSTAMLSESKQNFKDHTFKFSESLARVIYDSIYSKKNRKNPLCFCEPLQSDTKKPLSVTLPHLSKIDCNFHKSVSRAVKLNERSLNEAPLKHPLPWIDSQPLQIPIYGSVPGEKLGKSRKPFQQEGSSRRFDHKKTLNATTITPGQYLQNSFPSSSKINTKTTSKSYMPSQPTTKKQSSVGFSSKFHPANFPPMRPPTTKPPPLDTRSKNSVVGISRVSSIWPKPTNNRTLTNGLWDTKSQLTTNSRVNTSNRHNTLNQLKTTAVYNTNVYCSNTQKHYDSTDDVYD